MANSFSTYFCTFLCFMLFCMLPLKAADTPSYEPYKKILLVESYSSLDSYSDMALNAINNELLAAGIGAHIEVLSFSVRQREAGCPADYDIHILNDKLAAVHYDLVIALNNDAANLFLGKKVCLQPETMLLLDNYFGKITPEMQQEFNMSATVGSFLARRNIEFGVKLLPDTEHAVVLLENTSEGRELRQHLQKEASELPVKTTVIDGAQFSTREMLGIVRSFSPKTLLIYHSWSSSKEETPVNDTNTISKVKDLFPGVILSKSDTAVGNGSIGGIVGVSRAKGKQIGELAVKALQAGNAASIPCKTIDTHPVLDYSAVKKYGIAKARIPENVSLVNNPPSFFKTYSEEMWVCMLVLLAMLAISLFLHLTRTIEHKKYMLLVENLPLWMIIINKKGRILFSHVPDPDNGWLHPNMKTLEQLPEGHLRQHICESIKEAFARDESFVCSLEGEGKYRRNIYKHYGKNNPYGEEIVICVSIDVTELQKANIEKTQLAEKFHLILNSIGDGVIVTDRQETVAMLNPAAETMTGYKTSEAAGMPLEKVFNIVSYIDGSKVLSPLTRAMNDCRSVELANHTDLIAKDGSRLHIADCASPIMNHLGDVTGGVLIFRDVTEDYNKRDKLKRTLDSLEYTVKLTNSAYFQLSLPDYKVISSAGLFRDLWPVNEDGSAAMPDDVVYPDDMPEYERMRDLIAQGKPATCKFRIVNGDNIRYMRMMEAVDRSVPGMPFISGVLQDITDISLSEARYNEQQRLWHAVMDAMPITFAIKDADDGFRYVFSNKRLQSMFGMSQEEIAGKDDFELSNNRTQVEAVRRKEVELAETGGTIKGIQIRDTNDGSRIYSQHVKTLFNTLDGKRLILTAGVDITENILSLEYQKITSRLLGVLYKAEDIDGAVRDIMDMICKYLNADRGFLMRYSKGKKTEKQCLAEYMADDRKCRYGEGCSVIYNPEDPWYNKIQHGEYVFLPNVRTPEAMEVLGDFGRKRLNAESASLYGAGIFDADTLWGDYVFEFAGKPRTLSSFQQQVVKNAKPFIEMLLRRLRNKMELENSFMDQSLLFSCIKTLFLEEDFGKALLVLQQMICEHFGATRSFLVKFNLEEHTGHCISEYTAPGVSNMFTLGEEQPLAEGHAWLELFGEGKSILVYDMKAHENDGIMGGWQEAVEKYDIRSAFAAPIYLHGKLWGDVGIIYEGRQCENFSERELEMLNAGAHLSENILERQETRKRLQDALAQAQAADKAKSFFIASVSHEIRTPLNSVIGFSELLRHGNVSPEEQNEYLSNIYFSGNALLQLINDVLDLSKLEAEQMELIMSPVDFAELGKEVMKVFTFRSREKQVELRLETDENIPILQLDKQRIRQILFNLIGNAVKFTNKGSITLRASFERTTKDRGQLNFSVVDTGIGISRGDMQRLMKPFVQLHSLRGTNASNTGTGLGLSISKRLIERMGGSIYIDSVLNEGSTFGAVVPNVLYQEKTGKLLPEIAIDAAVSSEIDFNSISILAVDDVKLNLTVLSAICRKLGVKEVVSVLSGKDALNELGKRRFDAVLTDMWMPEMDGMELLRNIRKNPTFSNIPVVAVTADVETRNTTDFNSVLLKPITTQKLQEALEKALKNTPPPKFRRA